MRYLNIQMNNNVDKTVEIEIYNMQGQKVKALSRFAGKSDIISLDVNSLTKGIYIVKVMANGKPGTATFTKE